MKKILYYFVKNNKISVIVFFENIFLDHLRSILFKSFYKPPQDIVDNLIKHLNNKN